MRRHLRKLVAWLSATRRGRLLDRIEQLEAEQWAMGYSIDSHMQWLLEIEDDLEAVRGATQQLSIHDLPLGIPV